MIQLIKILGSIRVAIVCMALLVLLVLLGTLYQAGHGLYIAQETFFYSWIASFEFEILGARIPMILPGGALVMTVFSVNLGVSMLVHFAMGWKKAGIWLAHIGVLMMMIGGAYTKLTGVESYLTLAEGQASNLSADYRHWEFSLWTGTNEVREVYAVDAPAAARGPVAFSDLGVKLSVDTYHTHAKALTHSHGAEPSAAFSASGITELQRLKPNNDPQRNMPGAIVTLRAGEASRKVMLFAADIRPATVKVGDREVTISLRRVHYPLPVLVRLDDFVKETYANSGMAKAFSSRITVTLDDRLEREVKVEMNKPFRHLGWTFYQASFSQDERGGETSTFAVTRNYGRLIPYFATGITFIGMTLHFGIGLARGGRGGKS